MQNLEFDKLNLKNLFFIAFLCVLGVFMLQMFGPFINIIIIALVMVQLFHPVYRGLKSLLRSAGLASFLTTLLTLTTVVVPVILISLLVIDEIAQLAPTNTEVNYTNGQVVETTSTNTAGDAIQKLIDDTVYNINVQLNNLGLKDQLISSPNLDSLTSQILVTVKDNLLSFVGGVLNLSAQVLFASFMFIVTLLYMFPGYERLLGFIKRISPLDDEIDTLLFTEFKNTTRAVIVGSFLVAIAQATAVIIAMLLMGVGSPVLLWLIMVILGLIPVGSGLVWAPVGVAFILSGQVIPGILLIVYSAVIINVIDAALRPILMRSASVGLHPLLVIFSALGGIGMFGPLGILYGPVLVVFFTSLMNVYNKRLHQVRLG